METILEDYNLPNLWACVGILWGLVKLQTPGFDPQDSDFVGPGESEPPGSLMLWGTLIQSTWGCHCKEREAGELGRECELWILIS